MRMYISAMTSGLIRELGDERWTTLCILAMHMREDGRCYPPQDRIAKLLGIGRQAVNKRIRSLLEFKFNGEPIIELVTDEGIDRRNNVYRLLPASQLAIFNGEIMPNDMSPQDDINEDMSPKRDTNYITVNTVNNTVNKDNNSITVYTAIELKNAPDIIKYFCKKYSETYSVEYNVNWRRDSSMVKNKLLKTYSIIQIKDIIDITFDEYEFWASREYPRPTIGQLVTWIPNKALAVLQVREKKLAELEKAMSVKKTSEDILDLMDRGLQ